MLHAGHTVVVSGSALIGCFIALAVFPGSMLQTSALGCIIAISVAMMVNLSLTPAMILRFPFFFRRSVNPSRIIDTICCGKSSANREYDFKKEAAANSIFGSVNADNDDDIDDVPLLQMGGLDDKTASLETDDFHNKSQSDDIDRELGKLKEERWFRFATFIANHKYFVIALLVLLAALCVDSAINFRTTLSMDQFLPRGDSSSIAYSEMGELFGYGVLTPYYLLGIAPSRENFTSPVSNSWTFIF